LKIAFFHQNFPGQFLHLSKAMLDRGDEVLAFRRKQDKPRPTPVKTIEYATEESNINVLPNWLQETTTSLAIGARVARSALSQKKAGFHPDIVFAHCGWGEALFLKEIWPDAKIVLYCELYYHPNGKNTSFDKEIQKHDLSKASNMRLKNMLLLAQFEAADAFMAPTKWQAEQFPNRIARKMKIVHDGVDTDTIKKNNDAVFELENGNILTKSDKIITLVNRNLEPARGYHKFIRAIPEVLSKHQDAQVVIVGAENNGYGVKAPKGTSWKEFFLKQVRDNMDSQTLSRIHFVGRIDYNKYLSLLNVSTVHTYLTYPFVLSWSLIEAMASECAIVASNTPPVAEVISHGREGMLCDFHNHSDLAAKICHLLDNPSEREILGKKARAAVLAKYDLHSITLPQQMRWLDSLAIKRN
jgi:glycosyltransferase involved in cell wall biosynthesis